MKPQDLFSVVTIAVALTITASSRLQAQNGEDPPSLVYRGAIFNGENGVEDLNFPLHLDSSPDGRHLYVISLFPTALVVLERDLDSGQLSFVESHHDGENGVTGMSTATDIKVSLDGELVLVSGFQPGALVVFERNPETGALSHLETQVDIPDIDVADLIAVGEDQVILAGRTSEGSAALAFFRRAGTASVTSASTEAGGRGQASQGSSAADGVVHEETLVTEGQGIYNGITTTRFGGRTKTYAFSTVFVLASNSRELQIQVFQPDVSHPLFDRQELVDLRRIVAKEGETVTSMELRPSAHEAVITTDQGELIVVKLDATGCKIESIERVGLQLPEGTGEIAVLRDLIELPDRNVAISVDLQDTDNTELTPAVGWSFTVGPLRTPVDVHGVLRLKELDERLTNVVALEPVQGAGENRTHVYAASTGSNAIAIFEYSLDPNRCVPDATTLCLSNVEVTVDRSDFQGNTGPGFVVPGGSPDSGLFYFFDPDNWEMLVKVLDACALNDHFWVFAAATTNVEYTLRISDPVTGEFKEYRLGNTADAITDTGALSCRRSGAVTIAPHRLAGPPSAVEVTSLGSLFTCADSDTGLCLTSSRFQVEVDWRDFQGNTGSGRVVPLRSADSGLFYFFEDDNWEMLVKVLDACSFNQRFWVLAAATTTVEYTLRITDSETGVTRDYFNPLGTASPAILDTDAFGDCNAGDG